MKTFKVISILLLLSLLLGAFTSQQYSAVSKGISIRAAVAQAPGPTPVNPSEEAQNEQEFFQVPIDPNAHPELVDLGPETLAGPFVQESGPASSEAPAAPGDFAVYRNTTLLPADFANMWHVAEPSIGANGRMIYTSGNKYDGVSGNYGQNFSYINPFTIWPPPPPSTQFCCDQSVLHDRTHNMTLWLMQYHTQVPTVSGPNVIRLAVAHGQRELSDGTWTTYDIKPQDLTEFSDSQNWWWDYPDIALGTNYLYITINPNNHDPGYQQRAVIFRLSLDTLAAGAALPMPWPHYVTPTDVPGFARPTQGGGSTMYFGQHFNNQTLRLYTWPENAGSPTYKDIIVSAWYPGASTGTCADGTNWLGYGLMPVQAGWVAQGLIGFMWNSAQGGGAPYPNVRWVRIKESGQTINDQGAIWSNAYAWGFPSVNVNDRGDVGGTIGVGCGGNTIPGVNLQAWLADAYNSYTIQPLSSWQIAAGTNGPTGDRWGDYYATRPDIPYAFTFWGSGIVMNGGNDDAHTNVHLVWFGREQDRPPANNTIYGSWSNNTTYQDGTSAHPFRKAGDTCYATMPGDTVVLQAGTYNEPGMVIDRACFINNAGVIIH